MRRRRTLVAGGAGFLGSHLCDRLVDRGDEVLCVDDFSSGRQHNIAHLQRRMNFRSYHHDISRALPPRLQGPVDEVYNLACPASPPRYQRNPVQTARTNALGTLNLLELAQRHGARLFQASTSEVYGDPLEHPQSESCWGHVNPIGPRACYDEGKRFAETLCFDHHRQYGQAIKVARIFNTYGPRMQADDGRVVSNFIVQALCDEPITLYGNGLQTRSFCFVDDLIDGILALMASADDVSGPVNLGSPLECTVVDLAQRIITLTGSTSALQLQPLPLDSPQRRQPDIALARALLDWAPKVALDDGLSATIEYFQPCAATPP
jgi:UDP-glucuronate decarboxylase